MGQLKYRLISITISVLMVLVSLFDKDSVQLGLIYWPGTSDTVISTISLLGNLVWVLGIGYIIFASALIMYVVENGEKVCAQEIIKRNTEAGTMKNVNVFINGDSIGKSLNVTWYIVSIFSMGSGFWFTGTIMLLFGIISSMFRHSMKKQLIKILPEVTKDVQLSDNPLN